MRLTSSALASAWAMAVMIGSPWARLGRAVEGRARRELRRARARSGAAVLVLVAALAGGLLRGGLDVAIAQLLFRRALLEFDDVAGRGEAAAAEPMRLDDQVLRHAGFLLSAHPGAAASCRSGGTLGGYVRSAAVPTP